MTAPVVRGRHGLYRVVPGVVFSWESQARQYAAKAEPGYHHAVEFVDEGDPRHQYPIDCLTVYDAEGQLVGILNRYAHGFPGFEEPMSINVWVHPDHQRKGIGTGLVAEAERRWGPVCWPAQRVTEAGFRFAESYRDSAGQETK